LQIFFASTVKTVFETFICIALEFSLLYCFPVKSSNVVYFWFCT